MNLVKLLVQNVLEHRHAYDWTLQGFGMLRTYLDKDHRVRLHVWDDRYVVPGVSEMHTHPWNFESYIVAGVVHQRRFLRVPEGTGMLFDEYALRCGAGGGLCGDPTPVRLRDVTPEMYIEGDVYRQQADEIHVSSPERGTVTLVDRSFMEDTEHASVFTRPGEPWGSAEPRPATGLEVMAITRYALHRWFTPNPNYE